MAQQDTPAAGSGQTPDQQMREFMDHEFSRKAPEPRRLGRFTVSEQLLRDSINTGIAARLFYGSVPLDVQRDWMANTTTFLLWHPQFDEVPEGCLVPAYMATVTNGVIEWDRIEESRVTPATEALLKQIKTEGGAA